MVGLDMLSLASHRTDCTSTTETKFHSKRNFFTRYESYCKKLHVHPLKEKAVGPGLKSSLDLMIDKIKFTDWIPLLKALSSDRSLHSITFKSRIQATVDDDIVTERGARDLKKGVVLFTTYMLRKFTASCMECLEHSDALRLFHLENIPIPMDFIRSFAEGISKTSGLQKLLMVGCKLGDEGCQIITESLKNVPSIHTLDLSANDISCKGAENIANLIKFQGITRYNECWKHSLRAREVNTEMIPGLRRFSINDNQEVTDEGLKYIVEALADDNWIKAIDMQRCGITDMGCSIVSRLLETNKDIVVFDLRKNNVVDIMAIPSIMNQLNDNKKHHVGAEYKWIFIPNTSSSEDSSSGAGGGSSSSSYNLAYTNEKVTKYVETTVNIDRKNPVRTIRSDSRLKATTNKPSWPNRQVKFYPPIQRSTSSVGIKSTQQPRRNLSKTSAAGVKKKVTSLSTNSLFRVDVQKHSGPSNQLRKLIQHNPDRELETSLNQITHDLTPLSLHEFKVEGTLKPNRRIKETKKVCCLYFNRLEDSYSEE